MAEPDEVDSFSESVSDVLTDPDAIRFLRLATSGEDTTEPADTGEPQRLLSAWLQYENAASQAQEAEDLCREANGAEELNQIEEQMDQVLAPWYGETLSRVLMRRMIRSSEMDFINHVKKLNAARQCYVELYVRKSHLEERIGPLLTQRDTKLRLEEEAHKLFLAALAGSDKLPHRLYAAHSQKAPPDASTYHLQLNGAVLCGAGVAFHWKPSVVEMEEQWRENGKSYEWCKICLGRADIQLMPKRLRKYWRETAMRQKP